MKMERKNLKTQYNILESKRNQIENMIEELQKQLGSNQQEISSAKQPRRKRYEATPSARGQEVGKERATDDEGVFCGAGRGRKPPKVSQECHVIRRREKRCTRPKALRQGSDDHPSRRGASKNPRTHSFLPGDNSIATLGRRINYPAPNPILNMITNRPERRLHQSYSAYRSRERRHKLLVPASLIT